MRDIYSIDREINRLENFIDIFSKDLEVYYLERESLGSNDSLECKIFKLENTIMDYSEKLDELYFHKNLILVY